MLKAGNELQKNSDKLHTTELGIERIKRNLSLDTDDLKRYAGGGERSSPPLLARHFFR